MLKHLGFKAIVGLTRILPRGLQYALARRLADINRLLDRRARRAVEANLRVIAGPDAPISLVREQSRWVFRSFGMYLCEFLGHSRYAGAFIDRHVVIKGREHLDAALRRGQGVLFCSAHYSNWELGATVVARLGYPITAIVQLHADPRSSELFVRQREAAGIKVVPSQHGAKAALKALRANETVAILGDRPTGGPTVDVQLCGRQTALPQGPWRIALLSGAALLPTFVHRHFNGGYTLEFGAPIIAPESGDRDSRMRALAQAWAQSFEVRLRSDPTQWAAFYEVWPVENVRTAQTQDEGPALAAATRSVQNGNRGQ